MLNFLNLNWSDGTGNIFKKLSLQETLKYQARKNCFLSGRGGGGTHPKNIDQYYSKWGEG